MGSNPILAAMTSGNASGSGASPLSPASSNESSNNQTPRWIRLPSDDLVEVRAGPGQALGHRVDVDLQRERTPVLVAELRGDVGGGHARGGQEAGSRVPL